MIGSSGSSAGSRGRFANQACSSESLRYASPRYSPFASPVMSPSLRSSRIRPAAHTAIPPRRVQRIRNRRKSLCGANRDDTFRDFETAPFRRGGGARDPVRVARRANEICDKTECGVDQRWVVENLPIPLAVVNGSEDPFVNLDYLDTLDYANLWEGRRHRLPGLKHAPFWEAPDIFNSVLERFSRLPSTLSR